MNGKTVGIVANGPEDLLPDLKDYNQKVDLWIGADRGAQIIQMAGLPLSYAVGDFDSVNEKDLRKIKAYANQFELHPREKDKTDLELALEKALDLKPEVIILFGATGGRKDHELVNVQLLYSIVRRGTRGVIADRNNWIEMKLPGTYEVAEDLEYPNISFLPFSKEVEGLTLSGFYYPLENGRITWGSTLAVSNKLTEKSGTFSYEQGILLVVKSRDSKPDESKVSYEGGGTY